MKPRRRTMRLKIGSIKTNTAWVAPKIVIDGSTPGAPSMAPLKRVFLVIETPFDLMELRSRLDEIEAYWRKQLDMIKPEGTP